MSQLDSGERGRATGLAPIYTKHERDLIEAQRHKYEDHTSDQDIFYDICVSTGHQSEEYTGDKPVR